MKRLIALALAAALPVSALAAGSPPSESHRTGTSKPNNEPSEARSLEQLDKNRDGKLSRSEALGSSLERRFSELDKDGDENLSQAELEGVNPVTAESRK